MHHSVVRRVKSPVEREQVKAPKHPWVAEEPNFQIVLASRRGESVTETLLRRAHARIDQCVQSSATRVLRRWGMLNAEIEGEEIAQNWHVFMWRKGYDRIDHRPAHRFAYRVLVYHCVAAVRRLIRARFLPEDFDVADDGVGQMAALLSDEEHEQLAEAIANMPPQLRCELWPCARPCLHFPTNLACPDQERNKLYHARHRARQWLIRYMRRRWCRED